MSISKDSVENEPAEAKAVVSASYFGAYYDNLSSEPKLCFIKSKWIKHAIESDGMTEEDALVFWDFNIAGSKGQGQIPVIDDMFEDNDEVIEHIKEMRSES